MDKRWKCVFTGGYGPSLLIQAELEANDIPAFVPDQNLKTWDPYVVGGNIFDRSVFVPVRASGWAREILAGPTEDERAEAAASFEESAAVGPMPAEAQMPEEGRIAALARWIQWSTPFVLASPWALCLSCVYLSRVHKTGRRPARHGLTLLAMVVNTVQLCRLFQPLPLREFLGGP
jgi:hypothetical protein